MRFYPANYYTDFAYELDDDGLFFDGVSLPHPMIAHGVTRLDILNFCCPDDVCPAVPDREDLMHFTWCNLGRFKYVPES